MTSDIQQIYRPFDSMKFTNDYCFLCGVNLENQNSEEHVFPKWLLNKYDLWNQRIALLNDTTLPYRQMVIPCCTTCNNGYLSALESTIEKAVSSGYEAVLRLNEIKIYQWLSKIFYGILFRELSLLENRRTPSLGYITTPEMLERYNFLHLFLQSVRIPCEFIGGHPWSIFVLKAHSYDNSFAFDYHDSFQFLTFAIRMGEVCIMACLQDNGTQKEMFSDYFERFAGVNLHPIQCDELFAMVTYKSSLLNRNPSYVIKMPSSEDRNFTVVVMPIGGMSTKPIYNDWDQKDYAYFLENYWSKGGLTFDFIYSEPNIVRTYLQNERGEVHQLDPDGKKLN